MFYCDEKVVIPITIYTKSSQSDVPRGEVAKALSETGLFSDES